MYEKERIRNRERGWRREREREREREIMHVCDKLTNKQTDRLKKSRDKMQK